MDFKDFTGFDWNEGNINKNSIKHGVNKNECEQIFFDLPIYFVDEKHSQVEERYVVYGENAQGRRLTLVFTLRKNKIRVISARDQNKKEKNIYLESLIKNER